MSYNKENYWVPCQCPDTGKTICTNCPAESSGYRTQQICNTNCVTGNSCGFPTTTPCNESQLRNMGCDVSACNLNASKTSICSQFKDNGRGYIGVV